MMSSGPSFGFHHLSAGQWSSTSGCFLNASRECDSTHLPVLLGPVPVLDHPFFLPVWDMNLLLKLFPVILSQLPGRRAPDSNLLSDTLERSPPEPPFVQAESPPAPSAAPCHTQLLLWTHSSLSVSFLEVRGHKLDSTLPVLCLVRMRTGLWVSTEKQQSGKQLGRKSLVHNPAGAPSPGSASLPCPALCQHHHFKSVCSSITPLMGSARHCPDLKT